MTIHPGAHDRRARPEDGPIVHHHAVRDRQIEPVDAKLDALAARLADLGTSSATRRWSRIPRRCSASPGTGGHRRRRRAVRRVSGAPGDRARGAPGGRSAGRSRLRAMADDEVRVLEAAGEIEQRLRAALIPRTRATAEHRRRDSRERARRAALFAAELFRMYGKYAEQRRWRVELVSSSETGIGDEGGHRPDRRPGGVQPPQV
jgi:peptide chain release factor 1